MKNPLRGGIKRGKHKKLHNQKTNNMATLKDFISAQQINAIKAVATSEKEIQKAYVSDKAWELIKKTAINLGQKLHTDFWENVERELKYNSQDIVIFFKGKTEHEISAVSYCRIWAKHLGEMLKRGYKIVWIKEKSAHIVDWDNWRETYKKLTTRFIDFQEYDMPKEEERRIREKLRKEYNFYELAKTDKAKKGRARISFADAWNQRVKMQKEDCKRKTAKRAAEIMEML